MAEDDLHYAFLRIVQIKQPREQQWTHFGNSRADRMALLPIKVPENRRIIRIVIVIHAEFFGPAFQLVGVLELRGSRHGNA